MRIPAYAAHAADQPLQPTTITRREVGANDVLIEIRYAGICHSDIHTVRGEWGHVSYPLAPGHEIIGTVTQVGDAASKYQVGDTVGVGCMVNSCRSCEACTDGEEQYCPNVTWTYGSTDRDGTITQGGYSTHVVVNEDFVVRIPDGMDLAAATPLLCAGVTLFSPMKHWQVGPGTQLAIVGMGGLGHVGVKIACALGAEVTVLSHTLKKEQDGISFGANRFLATSDPATLPSLTGQFDLILNTVSADLNLNTYLPTLKRNGSFVELGLPSNPLSVSSFTLMSGRKRLTGSGIGSIAETQEMLDFCAEHGITATIELINADQINEAYKRVVASDVRYRFVIDAASFTA